MATPRRGGFHHPSRRTWKLTSSRSLQKSSCRFVATQFRRDQREKKGGYLGSDGHGDDLVVVPWGRGGGRRERRSREEEEEAALNDTHRATAATLITCRYCKGILYILPPPRPAPRRAAALIKVYYPPPAPPRPFLRLNPKPYPLTNLFGVGLAKPLRQSK